jgi:hypothetical protein
LRRQHQREANKLARGSASTARQMRQEVPKELPTKPTIMPTTHGWTHDSDRQGRRRGVLTDRPPDKPPPPDKGRSGGNPFGRADSAFLQDESSSSCARLSLRGNAALLDTIQVKVQTLSNAGAPQTGSISHVSRRNGRRPRYRLRSSAVRRPGSLKIPTRRKFRGGLSIYGGVDGCKLGSMPSLTFW